MVLKPAQHSRCEINCSGWSPSPPLPSLLRSQGQTPLHTGFGGGAAAETPFPLLHPLHYITLHLADAFSRPRRTNKLQDGSDERRFWKGSVVAASSAVSCRHGSRGPVGKEVAFIILHRAGRVLWRWKQLGYTARVQRCREGGRRYEATDYLQWSFKIGQRRETVLCDVVTERVPGPWGVYGISQFFRVSNCTAGFVVRVLLTSFSQLPLAWRTGLFLALCSSSQISYRCRWVKNCYRFPVISFRVNFSV